MTDYTDAKPGSKDWDWQVDSGVRVMIEAQEIRKNGKLHAAVKKALVEKAKAAQQAAAEENLEKKTSKNLKKVFGKGGAP